MRPLYKHALVALIASVYAQTSAANATLAAAAVANVYKVCLVQ